MCCSLRMGRMLACARFFFFVLCLGTSLHAADAPRIFRAGAATSNITPDLGCSINGGFQDGKAVYIHDELHARCLALDDGQTKLILVAVDSCVIGRDIFDAAKKMVQEST